MRHKLWLIAIATLQTMSLQAKTINAGTEVGFLVGILMVILFGILTLVGKGAKKLDQQLDKHNLSSNPNDIKTNEKLLLQTLNTDGNESRFEIADIIRQVEPDNFLATSVLAVKQHENQDYQTSRAMLEKAVLGVENGHYQKLLWKHFTVDFQKSFERDILSKVYYYHGHALHLNGNKPDSEKYKKLGKRYNSSVAKLNLY